jgi:hypothetical protein
MTKSKYLAPMAFVATLALAATPAYAQHRGGGGHAGGGSHGGAVARGGGSRGGVSSRGSGGFRGGVSTSRGVAQARSYPAFRGGVGVRGGVAVRGGARVAPRIGSRGVFFGRSSFYRPYYTFRPRLSLGFGLWAGYPVPYPYYYDYPYGYAYPYPADPYAYGYAAPSYGYPAPYAAPNAAPAYPPSSSYPDDNPSGQTYSQPGPSVDAQPGDQQAPGGVSFQIAPDSAAVFVDGTYVGTAGTFGPNSQPLGLIAGRHHIEIRASGYHTMTFDVDVTPGQVIPYQGTLQKN